MGHGVPEQVRPNDLTRVTGLHRSAAEHLIDAIALQSSACPLGDPQRTLIGGADAAVAGTVVEPPFQGEYVAVTEIDAAARATLQSDDGERADG